MKNLTIILPIYNDWESLNILIPQINEEMVKLNITAYIIIVDDGSSVANDCKSFTHLTNLARLTKITLNRNYGNQHAIAVGLAFSYNYLTQQPILVMDSDLEDKPSDIPKLIKAFDTHNKSEIIFAKRRKRADGIFFKIFYNTYKLFFRLLTGHNISFGNFSIIPPKMIKKIACLPDLWNHFPAAIIRSNLKYNTVLCNKGRRQAGKSGMNLTRLISHGFNSLCAFADVVAVRLLLGCLISLGASLSTASLLFFLRIFSDAVPKGTASILLMLAVIFITCVFGFSLSINFQVAISRRKAPLIPKNSYMLFIESIDDIFTNETAHKEDRNCYSLPI